MGSCVVLSLANMSNYISSCECCLDPAGNHTHHHPRRSTFAAAVLYLYCRVCQVTPQATEPWHQLQPPLIAHLSHPQCLHRQVLVVVLEQPKVHVLRGTPRHHSPKLAFPFWLLLARPKCACSGTRGVWQRCCCSDCRSDCSACSRPGELTSKPTLLIF